MIKSIRKMRIATILLLMSEILILIALALLYLLGNEGIRNYFTINHVLIAATVMIILNIMFVWVIVSRLSKIRAKSDIKSLQVIGGDVKEAYSFGMIGLVVVDKNFNILWTSDLFRERKIFVLDRNILTWQPDLEKLVQVSEALEDNIDDTIKLEIDSRNYEVKYLSDAGLFIFKDITELEFMFDQHEKQAPLLAL